ncbi:MAG: class I SAM-dependent rRNA methyltransferase [Alphaproteobacteria bacterium]
MPHPTLFIAPKHDYRANSGHPWLYSNEVQNFAALKSLPAGTLVNVVTARGEVHGTWFFNPNTLICARQLDKAPDLTPDTAWFVTRFTQAMARREAFFAEPFYRLIHSEGDGLAGLVIDRFDNTFVVQPTTAGMDTLQPMWQAALLEVFPNACLIIRRDNAMRGQEGLADAETEIVGKAPTMPITVKEGGVTYLADLITGQKTGWFYDQRLNRQFMAKLCTGKTVLDMCAHTGGFGLAALHAKAAHVTLVDSSSHALGLADKAIEAANMANNATLFVGDMFEVLEDMAATQKTFEVVMVDPPAFVKNAKQLPTGLKAYAKMARLAGKITAPQGWVCFTSCSHNASADEFQDACCEGLRKAGRTGRLVHSAGAAPDHPIHLHLPTNAYLKFFVFQVD